MAGTSEGNKKAAETTKLRYGQDFYRKAGAKSWQNPERSRDVGFAKNQQLAKEAGRKGGLSKKNKNEDPKEILNFLAKEKSTIESE